jgi:tetratricopeptide (TPR) repeat protein
MQYRELCLRQVEEAMRVCEYATAERTLSELQALNPLDVDVVSQRREVQQLWSAHLREEAQNALGTGSYEMAIRLFLEAIRIYPLDTSAREGLQQAQREAVAEAIATGKQRLQNGDYAGAVASFTAVQRRGWNSPEIAGLLRRARAAEAFAVGIEYYENRQYAPAIFQFKKSLRFDPDNAEVRRKLAYAQSFQQDTLLRDRFSRLE